MSSDYTELQSGDDEQQARELSLRHTRPPTQVPGYDLTRFLGSGAYGEVWIGLDRNTGRQIAVKFYQHRGGVDWSLLSREVEKLVLLSADRYIVQLLDVGWQADPPYYVMEFIENGSLEQLIQRDEPRSVEQIVELFREIATGLNHAHAKGILHCDLKPANVLLDQDARPRLADFGQSRLTQRADSVAGDALLHGSRAGGFEGRSRRPVGRVCAGCHSLLPAGRQAAAPQRRAAQTDREGSRFAGSIALLSALDHDQEAAGRASQVAGGRSSIGGDRRSMPAAPAFETVSQRAVGARCAAGAGAGAGTPSAAAAGRAGAAAVVGGDVVLGSEFVQRALETTEDAVIDEGLAEQWVCGQVRGLQRRGGDRSLLPRD